MMNPDLTIRLINKTHPISLKRIDNLIIYEDYLPQPEGSGKIWIKSDKFDYVNPYYRFVEICSCPKGETTRV